MQPAQRGIAERRRAAADAQLHQARAGAHQNAERARRDLGVERSLVAVADAVELGAVVGDDPGENIEPADRAFRVGESRGAAAQRHILAERHDIDAVLFEDRSAGQVDPMHRQQIELVAHARAGRRAESSPAPGRRPRPGADRCSPAGSGRRRSAAATGSRGPAPPLRAASATAAARSSGRAGGRHRQASGRETARPRGARSFG